MKGFLSVVLAVFFLALPALAENPISKVPRITPQELKAKMDKGEDIVILDVRAKKAFDASDIKIKGAVRVVPQELEAKAKELPMGKEIITYCT